MNSKEFKRNDVQTTGQERQNQIEMEYRAGIVLRLINQAEKETGLKLFLYFDPETSIDILPDGGEVLNNSKNVYIGPLSSIKISDDAFQKLLEKTKSLKRYIDYYAKNDGIPLVDKKKLRSATPGDYVEFKKHIVTGTERIRDITIEHIYQNGSGN